MKNIKENNYKKWIVMSDAQREETMRKWNPYEGDGSEIVKLVEKKFKEEHGKDSRILNISAGLYHGGMYIIGVTIKKSVEVNIPLKFLGFTVMKFWK